MINSGWFVFQLLISNKVYKITTVLINSAHFSEAQLNVLQCLYCRRKLGLWNYRSDSSSGHNTITDVNSVQTPQNSQCNEDKTTNTSCEKDSKENGHIDGDLLENGTRVPLSTDDSVKDASVEEPVKKRPKLVSSFTSYLGSCS